MTTIAMDNGYRNGEFFIVFPVKMVIVHSNVKLPEGNSGSAGLGRNHFCLEKSGKNHERTMELTKKIARKMGKSLCNTFGLAGNAYRHLSSAMGSWVQRVITVLAEHRFHIV